MFSLKIDGETVEQECCFRGVFCDAVIKLVLLGFIAVLHTLMRPIDTELVACLLVCLSH